MIGYTASKYLTKIEITKAGTYDCTYCVPGPKAIENLTRKLKKGALITGRVRKIVRPFEKDMVLIINVCDYLTAPFIAEDSEEIVIRKDSLRIKGYIKLP